MIEIDEVCVWEWTDATSTHIDHGLRTVTMAYVIAGSYEGHLIGYRLPSTIDGATGELDAAPQPSFAFKAHDGCVKAIAGGGRHLSTCGSDHTVCVYNLRKMRGQEKLLQQDGGALLQCLTFYADSHLVSGGSDGELCIWRTSDWACLLRMKGHKGAVHSIAVHPSGRAALSVAADSKLMLWNLTTGKCNYTAALSAPAWLVRWSPDGELYAHETRQAVLIYSLRSSEVLHTLPHAASPPLSLAFLSDGLLATGDDAGTLRVWSLDSGTPVAELERAHERRVKCITPFPQPGVFASASTDGSIRVWRWTPTAATSADAVAHSKRSRRLRGPRRSRSSAS